MLAQLVTLCSTLVAPVSPALVASVAAVHRAALAPAAAPAAVASDTIRYAVLMQGNPAGGERVWNDAAGDWRSRFHFNDRGRGPELEAAVRVGDSGRPVSYRISGVDYLKSPVREEYTLREKNGEPIVATWENGAERGTVRPSEPALYLPLNGTPAMAGIQARALLADPDDCLSLLPAGRACLRRVRDLDVEAGPEGATRTVRLYAFDGPGFSPSHVWLDEEDAFFASAGGWLDVVREGWQGTLERLAAAEEDAEARWLAGLAERLPERPEGPVAIVGARLFDPTDLAVRPGTTVLIDGDRIVDVGPDGAVELPDGTRTIDAAGRTLLPGLWDMHVHLSPTDGVLHLAAGVTSVRDLANDIDQLRRIREGFESGTAIGPRVIAAGFMDGPGPFAGPTKVLVDTEDEAREWVSRYAELGYGQIKVYSSIDTSLVPAIVEEAHARGLRVSGHVPAWMTAADAVRAGFDEIQHANMLFLNFLGDTLDTRTPLRFTAVAGRGAELDLAADSVRDFVRLLARNDVVVDPTVAIFENMFTSREGETSPMVEPVFDRLPPQVRRGFLGGGLPVPEGMAERYRASFRRMLDLVALLHEEGVRLVAGTDAIAGFALHRELELYAEAGIPTPEVLRIATLGAAEVAGRADILGSVEPGKLADLVLVDGDPTREISDIRRTALVLKGGVLYDPEALYGAIGVEGRSAAALGPEGMRR